MPAQITRARTATVASAAATAAAYHLARERGGTFGANVVAGAYLLNANGGAGILASGACGLSVFQLKAALWTPPAGMTLKLFMSASLITNAVAPAATFVFNLVPITAYSGGAATNAVTLGTPIAASAITVTTPALNTYTYAEAAADFAMPADGAFAVICTNDLTTAANSNVSTRATLYWRWV